MAMNQERFDQLYYGVFTTNDRMKICGRSACMRLLDYLYSVCDGIDFGNQETGFLNVGNVVAYHQQCSSM